MQQQIKGGVSIKDFEQLKVLGKGSYAKVTLVRKKSDNKVYAMKILKKQLLKERDQEARTITERNVLIECDHPFIIELKYSFQTEKKLFFVLEFCQGGELFNLLCRTNRFSEEVARFYASQMLLCLQYLHDSNIIYRDLKPENVLIDNTGYIKITDFGLSRQNINGNSAYSVCGTPEYMAPEVLLQAGHGKSVDYWSLGCIIYEMVTCQPPFFAQQDQEKLFKMIKTQEVQLPHFLTPALRHLLEGLFQKNPEQRLGIDPSKGDIRNHPWFTNVSWDHLIKKQLYPPYLPKVKDACDVSNFDEEFVKAEVHSFDNNSIDQGNYKDFSYSGQELSPRQGGQQMSPMEVISNNDALEEEEEEETNNQNQQDFQMTICN